MMNKMQERKKLMIAGVAIALIIVVLALIFVNSGSDRRKLNGLLDLGDKYLAELSYEDAILVFDEAIAIDPKCAQAYLGKAQAQYALGRYEEAVITLQEGIEQVDDSTELEAFLQQILNEISERTVDEEIVEVEDELVEIEERSSLPLLNYVKIVRRVDTAEPEIQLEVLGGDTPEHYTWESSNPECVTVSETGLVTCLPVVGSATVRVSNDGMWSAYCDVQISDSEEIEESEKSRIETGDEGKHLTITLKEEEGQEEIGIIEEPILGAYVYYSGDVLIPDHLAYQGRDLPVTSFSTETYCWCNTMKSISIPASVEIEDEYEDYSNPFYYCFALEEIYVDESNSMLKSVDGVLYSKDGKELLSYPAAKGGSTFTVPDEVEKIWRGAFIGCKNLEKIVVGEGNAYYKSIDGVLMDKENWLIAYPIGRKAASYSVPEEITQIAENAFYMSDLEEVVCKSAENISSQAFRQCKKLKKIEGGNATKEISIWSKSEDKAASVEIIGFDKMENLESLYVDYFPGYAAGDDITADFPISKLERENIKNLKSLKEIEIRGSFCLSDFSWLDGVHSLERLCIRVDKIENDDLAALQSLTNLNSLEISGIETLTDISWIEDLYALRRVDITAESIETEDFSQFFELPNLEILDITNYSDSDGLEEWFETMQAENPDMRIDYSERG